jgi:hypothetical protein
VEFLPDDGYRSGADPSDRSGAIRGDRSAGKKFGWTIEAQVVAARMGAAMCEVPASERPRLAGTQKVSGVTWRRTFSIGCRILVAGLRAQSRFQRKRNMEFGGSEKEFVAHPQRGS